MNSSLTYNFRKISALICAVILCLSLCSCKSKQVGVYRIDSLKWINNEEVVYTMDYTYTSDNKPSVVSVNYGISSDESYTYYFNYDKGSMESAKRVFMNGVIINLTPKKITSNKYILYDESEKEYLTIVFDNSGFIVSYRYTSGYVTEYAFTNDEFGAPVTFKQLEIRPSGSNRLTEFSIEYSSDNKFVMRNIAENPESNGYYEADYTKIIVEE